MGRNIVVLADGTGNSAAKAFKTNVWRLYQALDLTGSEQIAAFSDGVGTSAFRPFAVIGLALGLGVKSRVLALYKFLCLNHREGDRIYAFGFSRGAFIVRLVVGLLQREGLVDFASEEELDRNALAAYRAYRRKAFPAPVWQLWVRWGRDLRDAVVHAMNRLTGSRSYAEVTPKAGPRAPGNVNVRLLGVWDTVAAYGLPVDELTKAVDACVWPMTFENRSLLSCVERARQAFSIDDERRTFFPIPWEETAETRTPDADGSSRLLQVWFAGSHSNVGGGYPDDRLAHLPLCWMIGEAAANGLRFEPETTADFWDFASESGRIYDSRSATGIFYRYHPRAAGRLMGDGIVPVVDWSVFMRMHGGADGYAPIALPSEVEILLPTGERLAFDAARQARPRGFPKRKKQDVRDRLPMPPGRKRNLVALSKALEAGFAAAAPRRSPVGHEERVDLLMDTVWWRRGLYYFTLLLALLLALFPVLAGYVAYDDADRIGRGVVGPVVGLLGGFLPRLAAPWLDAVTEHPSAAAVLIALLAFCVWLNGWLRRRISDRARKVWNVQARKDGRELAAGMGSAYRRIAFGGAVIFAVLAALTYLTPGSETTPATLIFALCGLLSMAAVFKFGKVPDEGGDAAGKPLMLGVARWFRKNPTALRLYDLLRTYVLPGVFLAGATLLTLAAANKLALGVAASAGALCPASAGNQAGAPEQLVARGDFPVSSFCWDSGIRLEQGARYRLQLSIPPEDRWSDGEHCADTRGFPARAGPAYSLGTLFKRWWLQPWFKPVARIGRFGNDETVLDAAQPVARAACSVDTLVAYLQPQSSGELYLYVNDAAVMLPGLVDAFYPNNRGSARLTVERLPE
ncbi:MAG: DUF2235 domain-containing protein [Mesorhizobium sp.]